MTQVTLYHYPGCSTCKAARRWLESAGYEIKLIDLVANPPSKATLSELWKASAEPLKKLFNTSGQSYRNGGFGEKLKTLSDAEALAALAADGKLIKRPILVTPSGDVLIGFKAEKYAALAL
ncbi:MAG: Spx/MgsR family RNA polymerase-binding regulatory protein [Myxococcales bacterium]|nr:Spx/MgsR family RNA polymerase-binding regulatory protein [Myxococcales bacterium]MCB9608266.1 Spx/MgsR family RNA polymerase-binding regulatory protein [Polyangiaceae bacterium]